MQLALLLFTLLSLCGAAEVDSIALEPENIPSSRTFNSGTQAGILVGIVLGLLLLMTLLFFVHIRWIAPRRNNRGTSPT